MSRCRARRTSTSATRSTRATTPVLWDFVHTNEEGARLAAAALYSHLLPQLQAKAEALKP